MQSVHSNPQPALCILPVRAATSRVSTGRRRLHPWFLAPLHHDTHLQQLLRLPCQTCQYHCHQQLTRLFSAHRRARCSTSCASTPRQWQHSWCPASAASSPVETTAPTCASSPLLVPSGDWSLHLGAWAGVQCSAHSCGCVGVWLCVGVSVWVCVEVGACMCGCGGGGG